MLKYERIARRSLRAQVETARDDAGDEPPCIWLLSANPAYGPTYVYCLQGQSQGERFARHWYDLVRCAAERELYAARRAAGLCGRCGGRPSRSLALRLLHRARGWTGSGEEEHRPPGALRPPARPGTLHRLRRARAGGGEVRTLRIPLLHPFGPTSRPAPLPATLHRGRTRHRRGLGHLGHLGGSRHVHRLRQAITRGGRNHHRRIADGDPRLLVSGGARPSASPPSVALRRGRVGQGAGQRPGRGEGDGLPVPMPWTTLKRRLAMYENSTTLRGSPVTNCSPRSDSTRTRSARFAPKRPTPRRAERSISGTAAARLASSEAEISTRARVSTRRWATAWTAWAASSPPTATCRFQRECKPTAWAVLEAR